MPLACATLAALLSACAAAPPAPPDPNGSPESAQAIALVPRSDALRCDAESGPDCVDWFRFRAAAPGVLRVRLARRADTAAPPPAVVALELAVGEHGGAELGRATVAPETPVAAVHVEVREPKTYTVSIRLPPGAGAADYELSFETQAFREPPRPTVSRWTVLQVEGRGAHVLIDGGRRDGLRAGLRGRLREGERMLGRLVVVDVFEEGARARIEGPLAGSITPDTVAEIEGPAGSH